MVNPLSPPYDLLSKIQPAAEYLYLLLGVPDEEARSEWMLSELQYAVARRTAQAYREVDKELRVASSRELIGGYEETALEFLEIMTQLNALAHIGWGDYTGLLWDGDLAMPEPCDYYGAARLLAGRLRPFFGVHNRAEQASRDAEAAAGTAELDGGAA